MNKTQLTTKLEFPQIWEVFKNWKKITTRGKRWTVYSNQSIHATFVVYLYNIDTNGKTLNFRVENVYGYKWHYSNFSVPIRKEYTQKMFEKEIYSAVFDRLVNLETEKIYLMNEYQYYQEKIKWYERYYNVEEEVLDFFKNVTGSDLDKLPDEIVDDTFKWYLDNCSEYQKYKKLSTDFVNSKKFVIFADVFKHFISLIPYEDVREEYKNKIKEYKE